MPDWPGWMRSRRARLSGRHGAILLAWQAAARLFPAALIASLERRRTQIFEVWGTFEWPDAARRIRPRRSRAPSDIRLVIAASSAGTVFEWYDFFIYGTLGAIIGKTFFPTGNATLETLLVWAGVRGRLRVPAARRDPVRLSGRQAGPQVHVPGHGNADGCRHRRRRPDAVGRLRSAYAAPASSSCCASCRVWRWAANMAARRSMSRSIRRPNGAAIHQLHPGERGRRLRAEPDRRACLQGADERRDLGRMGLARAVPPLDRAAWHFAVDAREAQ
jgi:hypothetical protein